MTSFKDTRVAFDLKSNKELQKSYFLFRTMSKPTLVKIGGVLTQLAFALHFPIKRVVRNTIFNQFCGGINEEDSLNVVNKLASKKVKSVLHYSIEGEEKEKSFDHCLQKTLETISLSKGNENMPFVVFKPTGYGRFELYHKVNKKETLTNIETEEWNRVKERFIATCDEAIKANTKLLIDAEESWIQDAIDGLVEDLMVKYNKKEAWIYTTVQMYRHDRLAYLKELVKQAKKEKYIVGVKLVRGAYMEKENERALKNNYPTPICRDKAHTDENYNAAAQFILENITTIAAYFGTHNEQSILEIIKYISTHKISKTHPHIWFAQLYGMSDIISFNLAKEGYQIAKYIPYGPIRKTIPYLIRRAKENTSIAGQTTRELELIKKEMKRRGLIKG